MPKCQQDFSYSCYDFSIAFYEKLSLIPIQLFGFLVHQYPVEILCVLSSLLLCLTACLFLWIFAESTTSSLQSVPYNYLVTLVYREWKKVVNPWEIMFVITWLTLREGFFWDHEQGDDYIAGFSVSSNPSLWCLYLHKTILVSYTVLMQRCRITLVLLNLWWEIKI